MLITFGASVTFESRDAVFTRTLSVGLVADFPRGSHGVTLAGLARLPVRNGALCVAVITFLTVMTMTPGGIMSTFQTNPAGNASGELIELHVEATSSRVEITLASDAFVGGSRSGSTPGAIEMEGLAFFAFTSRRIMFTIANQFAVAVLVHDAFGGVSVAFASSTHGQIRHSDPLLLRLLNGDSC